MYRTTNYGGGVIGGFALENKMLRYSIFVPKLYNLCKSLGFKPGKIMPSRAFCSDENQGFPIILLTKHFGTFPFNHGRVGGVVATDRHGPHAHHGSDVVIVQASHVGYDPEVKEFGSYVRLQTEDHEKTPTCGKICGVSSWYQEEYRVACRSIHLGMDSGRHTITIDNQLLYEGRTEGLMLNLEKMLKSEDGKYVPIHAYSTSKCFEANDDFIARIDADAWSNDGRSKPIGDALAPDLFIFKREIEVAVEGQQHLEKNLQPLMPIVVTSKQPALIAAMINSQVEFDRTYRTLTREKAYRGKRLFFVSGLHIDISPNPGQLFPLTKFVPWAAYYQDEQGNMEVWEQEELFQRISEQTDENPEQISLDEAISAMQALTEVRVAL